ncbi:MAG: (Fe-S)-binding protein [Nitrospirota bacterium]
MIKVERKTVIDPGIDETVKNLNPEKIEKTIKQVLEKESAARLRTYIQTCMHCGLCSEACHYYLSYNRDPSYSPAGKVRQTLWEISKRNGRVDGEFIKRYAHISYAECNLCRRCSMYCPFGIDIAYLMFLGRRICNLLKVVPRYLQDQANSHMVTASQAWVPEDDWIDTVQWLEEELRLEIKNGRIPLDREGAEIMYAPHSLEAKFKTHLLVNFAKIMAVAGIDWTVPSTEGWDSTNQAMHAGDFETMGIIERKQFEAGFRLKVKKIVTSECGHSFRAAVYEGTRWLGWKEPPITYIHPVELFYGLIKEGRIKIDKKIKEPVTIQEPCSIVRNRGLGDMLRYIVKAICEDFREVYPRYEHNYCCCAGAGVINYGPPWKFIRMEGGRVKIEQLKATGAKIVIAPCHSCHKTIEEMIEHYKAGMHVEFFSEILVETMKIPEEMRVVK